MNSWTKKLWPVGGFLGVLLLWQIAYSTHILPHALFPSPAGAFIELFRLGQTAQFWLDILSTLKLTLIAVFASACIGIPLGLLSGSSPMLRNLTDAPVDFFRSIPAPAMFPMAILLFGINDLSKVAVTIFACSLLIIVQVSGGVRTVNPIRRRALELFGANSFQKARYQLLPEVKPFMVTGIRLAISLALILIIVSEMLIGSEAGIGARLVHAQAAYLIEEMYGSIICIGIMGFLLNNILLSFSNNSNEKTI
jgi:ABC-type nitrate/sulfonate/bicarbonate transport system permease component